MRKKCLASLLAMTALAVCSTATIACNSNKSSATDVSKSKNHRSAISQAETDSEIDKTAERWADSIMTRLSLRQKIAQLFIPRLDITNNAAGYRTLEQVIGKEQMGGFLLGKGSISAYADLINRGQSKASVPLMITLDGEWGLSMRIPGTPRFPHNIALGAADDEGLMYEYGQEMARECRLMGIQVNFAPVLDVNSNPDNPVIGYRSFGEDPELVGRLGSAYSKGMAAINVMPVGKHFPGHGDTSTDSHKTLPIVDHSVTTLRNIDFKPFKMAIEAGIPAIMVGHLKIPALDKSGTPSSLSKKITTDWLMDSLGFKGLVFTDALAMKGATQANENNCVSAFLAGADVLLGSSSPVADLNAVETAAKSGKIDTADVDAKCRKMLIHKYKLGLFRKPEIQTKGIDSLLHTAHVDSLIEAMSRKAISVIKNNDNILPLSSKKVVIVNLGAPAINRFSQQCAKSAEIKTFAINGKAGITSDITKAVKDADAVIISVFNDSSWAKSSLRTLSSLRPCTGVFFINPFKITKFSGLDNLQAIVLAYDDIPHLRTAAADAIFGKIRVGGKLPVNLPGIAELGTGIEY